MKINLNYEIITVAEAATIQTFPKGYKFFGSQSIKYTQIGNAVPCNLAKAVVKMVIDILEEKRHIIPIAYDQQIKFL